MILNIPFKNYQHIAIIISVLSFPWKPNNNNSIARLNAFFKSNTTTLPIKCIKLYNCITLCTMQQPQLLWVNALTIAFIHITYKHKHSFGEYSNSLKSCTFFDQRRKNISKRLLQFGNKNIKLILWYSWSAKRIYICIWCMVHDICQAWAAILVNKNDDSNQSSRPPSLI